MRYLLIKRFAGSVTGDGWSWSSSTAVAAASSPLRGARQYAVSREVGEAELGREGRGVSYGLNWALAGRGIIVKDKAYHNLKASDLHQKGATIAERLSGLPIHIRGTATGGASEISKAHFSKLLKQVSSHLSAISNIFVQDGAVCSSPICGAKVRVISDNPSAALTFSNMLWSTPSRAISHDSCPLTVYVATSISPSISERIGVGPQAKNGFIAADIERTSLIICGKAFADTDAVKEALAAIAAPVISARGGIPLSARMYTSGESLILVFAPEDTIRSCSDLRDIDSGVVLSSHGVAPYYRTRDSGAPNLYKVPASVILASADGSGALPPVSKLSPGQAAYHFLTGYQNGKFVPTYSEGPSPIDPLELSKALLSQLKISSIPTFLVNVKAGKKPVTGKELVKLIESTLSHSVPQFESKGDLEGKFKSFLSVKYPILPEELSY